MLLEKYAKEVELFTGVCHRLADLGFVTSAGGNAAWRLEEDVVLITPTKTWKGHVDRDNVIFINMAGDTVEGTARPTGEKPMYLRFFHDRPDVKSVIHCHPPCACACAVIRPEEQRELLMQPFYPETVTEVGPIPTVPYGEPLTKKLADNFAPYLPYYNSFIMEKHGLVTMSRGDIYTTLNTIELAEASINSVLKAKAAGTLNPINDEELQDLSNVMATRDLPLYGLPGANKSLVECYKRRI
ncbi:MAG: class II aldolase/adducin family protein [Abditibacteriota bacterium]|nr:class II aldolase/adducin family protein [Abditibacteriota bacterium]